MYEENCNNAARTLTIRPTRENTLGPTARRHAGLAGLELKVPEANLKAKLVAQMRATLASHPGEWVVRTRHAQTHPAGTPHSALARGREGLPEEWAGGFSLRPGPSLEAALLEAGAEVCLDADHLDAPTEIVAASASYAIENGVLTEDVFEEWYAWRVAWRALGGLSRADRSWPITPHQQVQVGVHGEYPQICGRWWRGTGMGWRSRYSLGYHEVGRPTALEAAVNRTPHVRREGYDFGAPEAEALLVAAGLMVLAEAGVVSTAEQQWALLWEGEVPEVPEGTEVEGTDLQLLARSMALSCTDRLAKMSADAPMAEALNRLSVVQAGHGYAVVSREARTEVGPFLAVRHRRATFVRHPQDVNLLCEGPIPEMWSPGAEPFGADSETAVETSIEVVR